MYPFASVRWAWDRLWDAVVDAGGDATDLPDRLSWSDDVHARWSDPDCVVTHVCGWPYAAWHRNRLAVLGAFDLMPSASAGAGAVRAAHYRSVLVTTDPGAQLDDLVAGGVAAVANSADSLSGWLSLLAATVGTGRRWPGPVEMTGAHVESMRRLSAGAAQLACIDAWSLALISIEEPELVEGLHTVGHGPLIPTPAVVAPRALGEEQLEVLRTAFTAAMASDSTVEARRALLVNGWVPLREADYEAVLPLGPT
jgi:ABC-type phosphate/phosphonate transport system substrate-binding protein